MRANYSQTLKNFLCQTMAVKLFYMTGQGILTEEEGSVQLTSLH